MQVNIMEAKNRLSELIKSAQAGEEVVIASRGVPVARLVKAGATLAGQGDVLQWLADHPLPRHVRRTVEALESVIGEARDAWD